MLSLSARAPESTGIHASTKVPRAIRFDEKTPIPGRDRGLQEKARRFVGTLNLDVAPRMVRIASGRRSSGRRRSLGEVGGCCHGPAGPRRTTASRLGLASRFERVGPRHVRGPRSPRSGSPIHGAASNLGRLHDRADRDRAEPAFRLGACRPCCASASSRRPDRRRDGTVHPGVHVDPGLHRRGSSSARPAGFVARHRDHPRSWRGDRATPGASEATFDPPARRFVGPARV